MPRYFFDYFEDGELFVDPTGTDLPDDIAAEDEATAIASGIAQDHLTLPPSNTLIEVRTRDAHGRHLKPKTVKIAVDGEQLFQKAQQDEISVGGRLHHKRTSADA